MKSEIQVLHFYLMGQIFYLVGLMIYHFFLILTLIKIQQLDFTNWANNEPKIGEEGDCIRLKNDLSQFAMWRDDYCTSNLQYFCKKDKSKTNNDFL